MNFNMLKRTLPIGTALQILQNKSIWLVLKFIPKKTKFPEKLKLIDGFQAEISRCRKFRLEMTLLINDFDCFDIE